jgi:hypothetical protein
MRRLIACLAAPLVLLTLAAHVQAASAGKQAPALRQVRLITPPEVRDLPHLASERFTVYAPQIRQTGERPNPSWAANTYNHNALITWWKGRFYCAWTNAAQSEGTPFGGLLSSSADGAEWSPAVQPAGWEHMTPRGWHQTADRLYMWSTSVPALVWETADGDHWRQLAAPEVRDVDFVPSNKKFVTLRDGRVMACSMKQGGAAFPITSDPTGLSGWAGGLVDSRDCGDIGEPGGWQGRDGALHGSIRWRKGIWHTYSLDGGKTWAKLTEQPGFTDSPGNKEFGSLPNGWNWYVGNPKWGSRTELVMALSRDGWTFDKAYLIRWEPVRPLWYSLRKSEDRPGYEYPAAVYHDGALYIAYSRTRDMIEVCRVPLARLMR